MGLDPAVRCTRGALAGGEGRFPLPRNGQQDVLKPRRSPQAPCHEPAKINRAPAKRPAALKKRDDPKALASATTEALGVARAWPTKKTEQERVQGPAITPAVAGACQRDALQSIDSEHFQRAEGFSGARQKPWGRDRSPGTSEGQKLPKAQIRRE